MRVFFSLSFFANAPEWLGTKFPYWTWRAAILKFYSALPESCGESAVYYHFLLIRGSLSLCALSLAGKSIFPPAFANGSPSQTKAHYEEVEMGDIWLGATVCRFLRQESVSFSFIDPLQHRQCGRFFLLFGFFSQVSQLLQLRSGISHGFPIFSYRFGRRVLFCCFNKEQSVWKAQFL